MAVKMRVIAVMEQPNDRLLGGGLRDPGWDGAGMSRHRLAILPGVTHYGMPSASGLADAALAFLEN